MVRVIVYNIGYCQGISGNWWQYLKFWTTFFHPRKIERSIIEELKKHNPDIIGLIEIDFGSIRSRKDMANFFARNLNMGYVVQKIKYPKKGLLKLFHLIPILRKQGNAIISKYPLENIRYHHLSVGTKRTVIEASIKIPKKITILLAHLALGKNTRLIQIKELTNIVKKIKNSVILMGDFNTFDGKKEINDLLINTNLNDKYNISSKNINTYPSFTPNKRIDYILTSNKLKVKQHKPLKLKLSDHLPVLLDFT
ncbi:MAG: endonuclease/exonuclease/phosphatase family protein [Candidatus Woesearchaeota archaeon]|nr:MAG: endonuclease/exonuclease/phosphatase family protein [Candidatus Woesearchaeota archaeon]